VAEPSGVVDGEERVWPCCGGDGVNGNGDGAGGAVLEANGAGQRRGCFAVGLGFCRASSDDGETKEVG
jgi:hypothetical protein